MEQVPSCPFLCLFAALDVSRACLTRLAHQRCEASRVPESCSSSLWYSLTTVSHRSHAKGCWEEFLPTHVQWPHGYSIMIRASERQKYNVYNQIELHIGWKLWDEINYPHSYLLSRSTTSREVLESKRGLNSSPSRKTAWLTSTVPSSALNKRGVVVYTCIPALGRWT